MTKLEDARDHGRDVAFGWDLAGNLVSKEKQGLSRRLQWDGRNGLVRVADNGADVGVYDYDGAGLRTRRKTATEDVAYVLDGQFVLQELDASQPGRPAYRRYHYANEPLAVVDAAGARFVGSDVLGSPTELLSGSGAVVDRRQYDAWGQYRNGTAPAEGAP